jgi:hypothetical protein
MTSTGTYNVEDISNKLMASVSDAKYGVISVVSNIQISCTALTGVYLYVYGAN